MNAPTRAAPADPLPLYVTNAERETITAGLRAAAKMMENMAAQAHAAEMRDCAELLEHSSSDYEELARRIGKGELDQVQS